jgi:hypothetical protein
LKFILNRFNFQKSNFKDYISLSKLWASYSKLQEVSSYWFIFVVIVNISEL